jgi:hypothetical protein
MTVFAVRFRPYLVRAGSAERHAQFRDQKTKRRKQMHLFRKTLIPLAAVAIIAMAISVVGPHAVRAFTTTPPSFSPSAVRYPWVGFCNYANTPIPPGEGLLKNCDGKPQALPLGVELVIQTISFSLSTEDKVDAMAFNVNTIAGGNAAAWTEYSTPKATFEGTSVFVGSAQTTLYSEGIPNVFLSQVGGPTKNAVTGFVMLIGYYVYPQVPASVN